MTLSHHSLSTSLSQKIFSKDAPIDLEPIIRSPLELRSFTYESSHAEVYPSEDYSQSGSLFRALLHYYLDENSFSNKFLFHHLQLSDRSIRENTSFCYHILKPKQPGPFSGGILLFHGLNEKSWNKYLPWAAALAERTGRPIILFPIAFHMDRAPSSWSDPRSMIPVARERKKLFPDLSSVSFVNAALSHRIQFAPHRFVTSGLHSFFDARDFVRLIRSGDHPLFSEGASIDLFGYSIGAGLAQYLLLSDPDHHFADSRAFLFCGGAALDLATPVSKTIIDEQAHHELLVFFNRLFEDMGALGAHMINIAGKHMRELEWLKSLLFIDRLKAMREGRLQQIAGRITAAVMGKDRVFSPEAVRTTLTGSSGAIPIPVTEYDLPHQYNHENPFSASAGSEQEVDLVFRSIMDSAGSFYCNV